MLGDDTVQLEYDREKYLSWIDAHKCTKEYNGKNARDWNDYLTAIRNNLLKDIFSNKEISFDFIFGTKGENENSFIPLDGQQRLTTLFLLYLYQYKKDASSNVNPGIIDKINGFFRRCLLMDIFNGIYFCQVQNHTVFITNFTLSV